MRKSDVKMNELQEAEELIKREMITMLHNDALNYPAGNQISSKQNKRAQLPARFDFDQNIWRDFMLFHKKIFLVIFWIKINLFSSHVAYLERNSYEEVSREDLEEAREVLLEEVLYGMIRYLLSRWNLNNIFILVKQEMDHGEVTIDAFDQVWNECFNEVSFMTVFDIQNPTFYFVGFIPSKRKTIHSSHDGKQKTVSWQLWKAPGY